MIRILCVCLLLTTALSGKEMIFPERLFRMTGSETNVSQGDLLYKSQAAGYYSGGGGMVVRSPIRSTRFASAHLPEIHSGCGGIDIYTGGFSFISEQQVVDALQAIAANAAGYAFMLGIESVSPQMSNTLRQMQSWANTINGIGINSCETAARLVGSVWPANEMASEHICRTVGTSNAIFQDHINARHGCFGTASSQSLNDQINEVDPMGKEYNIAWMALNSLPFFKNQNQEMAEFFMTLVGTVIVKKGENGGNVPTSYFSKAEDPDFLQRIIEGGKITKYKCDERDKCLNLVEEEVEYTQETAWVSRIRNTLQSMQEKAITDQPLDSSEKGLLATTRLPLYRAVNVLAAYRRGQSCAADINNIADIVAWDVLSQVINEALEAVNRGCVQLKLNSMYENKVKEYHQSLDRIQKVVQRYEERMQKALDLEMRLIEKIQLLEKQVCSEIIVN